MRDRIHYQLEQKMFRALRGRVAIEHYAGKKAGDSLTHDEQFDAWFLRSISMAAHGLWSALDEDIRKCGEIRSARNVLISQERAMLLSQGFSHWYAYVDECGRYVFPKCSVARVVSALGRDSIRPLARGLYWAARSARADGERWLMLRCVGSAVTILITGWITRLRFHLFPAK